jgi:hypothetical protein
MNVLAGCDFFTVEMLRWRGLVTYYVLFFLHLESRRVHIAGITGHCQPRIGSPLDPSDIRTAATCEFRNASTAATLTDSVGEPLANSGFIAPKH